MDTPRLTENELWTVGKQEEEQWINSSTYFAGYEISEHIWTKAAFINLNVSVNLVAISKKGK